MKFSEHWLREWVDPPISTAQLSAQLTMAGLEVDAVTPVAAAFNNVVVGQVVSVGPHPEADRLQICRVDVGRGEALQIVCGAKNVRAGMKVPAALIGAVLPGDLTIKPAKLRGVESSGMLCSAKELGLAEQSDGLLPLSDDAPVGDDIRRHLQLDDVSLELGLTPNRSDCLSVAGIAREVGALNRSMVQGPAISAVVPQCDQTLPLRIEAPQACPRYLGRVIRGIRRDVQSPLWLRERLRRSGLRSIDPVVDVTNYVLLELGQPMHAFDLAMLQDGIVVRMARPGETLTLLDGQTLTLRDDTLVIADGRGPLALAGIMGGQASAVSDSTDSIFLESAFFAPAALAGKARSYGLHTDSSHRFERGVDPELPRRALERATRLLCDITGGQPGPVIEQLEPTALPQRAAIGLRAARLKRLLGIELPGAEVSGIFERLGLTVLEQDAEGWRVVPPSFRFDLAIEADLIEEVARIHGYHQVPETRARGEVQLDAARNLQREQQRRVRQCLVDRGYQEVVTYSFVDPVLQGRLVPGVDSIALANPISADMAVMRTSLWPGLVQALLYNLNRQQGRIRFFEIGVKFLRQRADIHADISEEKVLAGLVRGARMPEQWGSGHDDSDFFDVKGDIEALLTLTGNSAQFRFERAEHPVLHPGLSARITIEGRDVGWCGALHPQQAAELDVDGNVWLFELVMTGLQQQAVPRFAELSRFPAIRRDLALIVAEAVTAQQIEDCVRAVAGERLRDYRLFDVYRGKGIENGRKSLAIGLTLQDVSRTLTDADVESIVGRVLEAMQDRFGATLRE
ncbi:MAG: phenylalanine--tRNA ligase subunit beta [Gammaproteobacteria bacterium]|nr:phenylalanine--tRNA ligase subunit beta [Gammaproteobacteria bacterium]